ncbi:MAG: DUF1570 domain-containing protein [Planctomycetota bacterium]|nr:MAG: DUF1570 domain-containing protein [Planctomycetota bacterium]
MPRGLWIEALVCSCALGLSTAARADVVVFKDGRRLEGEVDVVGTRCRITLKSGATYEVEMTDVKEILRPEQTERRRARSQGEKSLLEEEFGRRQGGAGADVVEDGELPSPSRRARARLLEHCPRARIEETRHYVLVSTATRAFTRDTGKLLEEVRRGFYRFFRRKGFDLVEHPKKLVAYAFGSREEYEAYNREAGLGVTSRAAGFYHTATNALYLSDARNSPEVRRVKKSIAEFERALAELKKKRRQAEREGNGQYAAALGRHLRKERQRLRKFKKENAEFLEDANEELVIHEATHQLSYNSGLLIPSELNPEWLVEGLAMLFEDPGVWKGRYVKGANERRKRDLARALAKGRRMTVRDLVGSNRQLIARSDPGLAYGSAWALIHLFVRGKFRKYKKPFLAYLESLQRRARSAGWSVRGEEAAQERLEAFESFFGPVRGLEREYSRYLDSLVEDVAAD